MCPVNEPSRDAEIISCSCRNASAIFSGDIPHSIARRWALADARCQQSEEIISLLSASRSSNPHLPTSVLPADELTAIAVEGATAAGAERRADVRPRLPTDFFVLPTTVTSWGVALEKCTLPALGIPPPVGARRLFATKTTTNTRPVLHPPRLWR